MLPPLTPKRKKAMTQRFRFSFWLGLCWLLVFPSAPAWAQKPNAKVYVILWFDTEDYILPASDDAAKRLADFLTSEKIKGTFKVVGEKARTLARRDRHDVIAALKEHEIGYHSNWHSLPPSPAQYLEGLGWDEGVAEFDRRERPGFDDVKRIFGCTPTCYGQPGSSWGPQSYGAMRKWGMRIYLDAGSHVNIKDRPCYYCGVLNLYKLAHLIRADLKEPDKLPTALDRFAEARKALSAEGGGVVSTIYHPCEFVHKEFWDGVNFRRGANPPPEEWKLPPEKSEEEKQSAFKVFENYIHFMKRFDDVRFITASEAAKLYCDKSAGHSFTKEELTSLAKSLQNEVTFWENSQRALSPAEALALLNKFLIESQAGPAPESVLYAEMACGPVEPSSAFSKPLEFGSKQFLRAAKDVQDYMANRKRVPSTVWVGSQSIPPEAYLAALARVDLEILAGKPAPEMVEIKPVRLTVGDYVANDDPRLWGWVIFPPGFRAPKLMELARRQSWTLKPALLSAD